MGGYIIQRLVQGAATVLVLLVIVFMMIRVIPGGPAALMLGAERYDQEEIARLRDSMGLNRPIWHQFGLWLSGLARGDLGYSYYQKTSVASLVISGLRITLPLIACAMLLTLVLGLGSGMIAAARPGSGADRAIAVGTILGVSFPHFWIGLVLIFFFAVRLRWLPSGGYAGVDDILESARHLLLPAVTLGLAQAAFLARLTRGRLLDILGEEYCRTARAKGVRESTVFLRHAMKNTAPQVLTAIGLALGVLIGGTVVVETVFTIPGFGRLLLQSIVRRDYPVAQACILTIGLGYILTNLAIDLLYGYLDPRIRDT